MTELWRAPVSVGWTRGVRPRVGGAIRRGTSWLTWRALVSFEHGILTVSTPDGLVFSEEFKGGAGVSLNPVGQANYQPPDGTYIWQVVLASPRQ